MNAEVSVTVTTAKNELSPDNCVGAGILLYMARNGAAGAEVAFVLAQEDFFDGWNQSGCWSAFEGGAKDGETAARTAAREFCEETMDVVGLDDARSIDDIERRLLAGDYAMRVTVWRDGCRPHVTYLVRIPWGTDVVSPFAAAREPLGRLRALCAAEESVRERMTTARSGGAASAAHLFLMWLKRYSAVHEAYARLPQWLRHHGAVQHRPSDAKRSATLSISPEFLEKRAVRVVPLEEIRYAMQQRRGRRRQPRRLKLRYKFVPVIKAVIAEIDRMQGLRRAATRW